MGLIQWVARNIVQKALQRFDVFGQAVRAATQVFSRVMVAPLPEAEKAVTGTARFWHQAKRKFAITSGLKLDQAIPPSLMVERDYASSSLYRHFFRVSYRNELTGEMRTIWTSMYTDLNLDRDAMESMMGEKFSAMHEHEYGVRIDKVQMIGAWHKAGQPYSL